MCYNTWWENNPAEGSWGAPYREFLQLKWMLLKSKEQELNRINFFVSFCKKFNLKRRRTTRPTSRMDEIDISFGRLCLYASRLYMYCRNQKTLDYYEPTETTKTIIIGTTMTQVMRTCMITRAALMSCIPSLLASPTLDCIDMLYVKFNQHLIDLAEITTRMTYYSRNM